ncbi:alpha/beta hydrolase [Pseudoroseicyclus tamaricis]|uniref:Alpha/beta hydrolase n=1 Tax=Pseudoroseicyclus tamaricis TaxID=2705421 RepID=A0A6B2K5B5_9RHOB|nr:alpha/beta hydrolase [Pseudoroseicyclus tamaricis]NDV01946.1 alpha/beta hydrolase [Pseudoroseicyclus tamaricis]
MALLRANADDLPSGHTIAGALRGLHPGAPIVVMIHGYRFSPADASHDPHRHILSPAPSLGGWKAVSWPRHLRLQGEAGLAVAFGWEARGTLFAAHARAEAAGAALAELVGRLRVAAPDRPIHLLGHSLGARVALAALARARPGDITRVLLLSAAAFRGEARRVLETPAGRRAEIVNVISGQNLLFDTLLRLALPHHGVTLGGGLGARSPGWVPGWVDVPMRRLPDLGYRLAPPTARICHWSSYLRPGVWRFYREVLLTPEATPLAVMQARLAPERRRWRLPAMRFGARGPV